jgi:phage tail sheath protein FI
VSPQYKYIAVRRLAPYIEQSLDDGLRWAVFEPNTPALCAIVWASVDDFLRGLWLHGWAAGHDGGRCLFRALRPCVRQRDVDLGRLIMLIGFAPVRPAEFVIIRLTIIAQDIERLNRLPTPRRPRTPRMPGDGRPAPLVHGRVRYIRLERGESAPA